jgi:hypothetical protein
MISRYRLIVPVVIAVKIVLALKIARVLSAMVLIYLMYPRKGKVLSTMVLNIIVLEGNISCLRFLVFCPLETC